MSERHMRWLRAGAAALCVGAGLWLLLFRDSRTTLTIVAGGMLLLAGSVAAYTALSPRALYDVGEARLSRRGRKPEKDALLHTGSEAAVLTITGPPPQFVASPVSTPAPDATPAIAELRDAVRLMTTELKSMRDGLTPRLRSLEDSIQLLAATVADLRAGTESVTAVARPTSVREERPAARRDDPRQDVRTGDSDSVHDSLHQLAERCMSRGLSIKRVREELPAHWRVEPLDPSETPDAFLVSPTGNDMWVVPNTREWLPFRGRGWFDVAGMDDISARITTLSRLPRLGRSQKVLQRGSVEVAV